MQDSARLRQCAEIADKLYCIWERLVDSTDVQTADTLSNVPPTAERLLLVPFALIHGSSNKYQFHAR